MKKNLFQCEFKEIEVKNDIVKIKWFASTPEIDRYNDIVDPNAFKNSIDQYMKNPIILLQHNSDKPLGTTVKYTISESGLEINAEIVNNIENTFDLIRNGVLKGFSIGYIPTKWEYVLQDWLEIRKITELDLVEISVVSIPANANSLFTLGKSIKSFFDEMEKEKSKIEEIKTTTTISDDEEPEDLDETKEEVIDELIEEIKKDIIETPVVAETKEELNSDGSEIAGGNPETEEANIAESDSEAELLEEIKSLKDMIESLKKEMEEQKSFIDTVFENVIELWKKTVEIKSSVDSLPIKRGLATIGSEKKTVDPFFKQLMDAKNNS